MSFLYHKKTTKFVRWMAIIVALLVALSMIITFAPGLANKLLQ